MTLVCIFLGIIVSSPVARAQVTTSKVNVLVTGKRCSELKEVYLVVNGDDVEDRWIRLDPAGACRWRADIGDPISTSVAGFSLRGDFARTDCQMAVANEEELSANLEFACCVVGPLRNVMVKIEPSMPVSYVRDVRPFVNARIRGMKKCLETGVFSNGLASIGGAQFSGEDVYLRLGPVERKQYTLGLLLNDVVSDDGKLVLTRDGLVYRMIVQRAKGKGRSAPTLSSNAISLDVRNFGQLKLDRAEIEVVK
jgi:hypothetical protein